MKTIHWYELETDKGYIDIEAVSRAQARRIAEKQGYTVYSINMMG